MLIIVIRSMLLYLLIIFSLRLMGKKQLGELQPSELVTTILISNIATLSLEDPSLPMLMGIFPILMIVCLDVLMSGIMLKNDRIRRLITGTPKIIISNGCIDQKIMKTLRYTVDDLLEAMHDQGIFDIAEVQYAIVETTGKINFLQKSPNQINPPEVIIKDGRMVKEAIDNAGIGSGFVNNLLVKNKVAVEDVFLLMCDGNGSYTLIREDNVKGKKE